MTLGYYEDHGETIPLTNERRFSHTHVIGKAQVGKTTALINYILEDIENGEGLLFIDPHGDAIDEILSRIPKDRAADTILLDFADIEFPPGLNLFHNISRERHARVAGALVDIVRSIWDYGRSITPRLNLYLRAAARVMLCVPNGTLIGIYYLIMSDKHRAGYLAHVKDDIVHAFWKGFDNKKPKEQDDLTDSTLTRIFEIVSDPRMRNIVGQYRTAVNLKDIMDGRKIVLASLPEGVLGRDISKMLGCILLCLVHLEALERITARERVPFHVYVDEAHHFAGTVLAEMLSGIGKYAVSLTLCHQYLAQFDPDFQKALLGTVGNLVCFQVGPADAEPLQLMLGLDRNDLYDGLTDIPPFHAYGRSQGKARLLTFPPLPDPSPRQARAIRRRSSSQHAGRRKRVEDEVRQFIAGGLPPNLGD